MILRFLHLFLLLLYFHFSQLSDLDVGDELGVVVEMMGVNEMTMLNIVVGEMMEIVGEVMAVDGIVAVGKVVERGGVGKVDLTPKTQRLIVEAEVVLAFD